MNTGTFFLNYETFTRSINYLVQAVKNNNGAVPLFTNAQKAAVIAGANTAIDELNDMREEVYTYTGITVTFPAYDNTTTANASVFTPTYTNANSLRISLSDLIVQIQTQVMLNQGTQIADSYVNNPTYTKSGAYTSSELAAIAALTAINAGLFV